MNPVEFVERVEALDPAPDKVLVLYSTPVPRAQHIDAILELFQEKGIRFAGMIVLYNESRIELLDEDDMRRSGWVRAERKEQLSES